MKVLVLHTNGNCDVFFPFFQIQQNNLNNEEAQIQQDVEIDFERMADLINEAVSNPQSGELNDCSDQIYDL